MNTEKKENKNSVEPQEMVIADIVENEEDKKLLEPVQEYVENSMGRVIAKMAYIRDNPNNRGNVIAIVKYNDTVSIAADGSTIDYYKVTGAGKVGFIKKDEITVE